MLMVLTTFGSFACEQPANSSATSNNIDMIRFITIPPLNLEKARINRDAYVLGNPLSPLFYSAGAKIPTKSKYA